MRGAFLSSAQYHSNFVQGAPMQALCLTVAVIHCLGGFCKALALDVYQCQQNTVITLAHVLDNAADLLLPLFHTINLLCDFFLGVHQMSDSDIQPDTLAFGVSQAFALCLQIGAMFTQRLNAPQRFLIL